ncbi:MAG: RpiB/LacA/LacB family sugar-phosphate isomerase [Lentisphaeria bacterium]|nr:RpiB/LacA/LacB family sugar-phosphate isomerase [Lentisphaeria bacterium]
MNIVLASDPFAYSLKKVLIDHLQGNGHTVIDADHDSGITYYEAAEKGVAVIQNGEAEYGIFLCGTGAGMCIAANKFTGIYAVSVESVFSAVRAKAINNANVITMGAMIVGNVMACDMADAWLNTGFTQGLENLSDFLHQAEKAVAAIDQRNRK